MRCTVPSVGAAAPYRAELTMSVPRSPPLSFCDSRRFEALPCAGADAPYRAERSATVPHSPPLRSVRGAIAARAPFLSVRRALAPRRAPLFVVQLDRGGPTELRASSEDFLDLQRLYFAFA